MVYYRNDFSFFYETYKNASQNYPFYTTPNVYVFSVCKITKTWKFNSFLSEESIYICKTEVLGVLVSDIMKQEHWSKSFTFNNVYKKEILIHSTSFKSKVMNKKL